MTVTGFNVQKVLTVRMENAYQSKKVNVESIKIVLKVLSVLTSNVKKSTQYLEDIVEAY